eukprot:1015368-Pyramimonas_sp.AAC.1
MKPCDSALGRHLKGLSGRLGPLVQFRTHRASPETPDGVLGVSRDRLGPPGLLSEGSPRRF